LVDVSGPISAETPKSTRLVSLGDLCDRFVEECAMFLDNDPKGSGRGKSSARDPAVGHRGLTRRADADAERRAAVRGAS
jgi:hypothetical protein